MTNESILERGVRLLVTLPGDDDVVDWWSCVAVDVVVTAAEVRMDGANASLVEVVARRREEKRSFMILCLVLCRL